jgi:hypothetical protein
MWLKLTDDFPARCAAAGLSDAAVRTHIDALCSIMAREKGPVLAARELRRFLESEDADRAITELLAAGWWIRDGSDGAVRVVENMADQPEPEVIAKRREATAERKRRERLRKAGLDVDPDTGEVLSRVTSRRDGTRDPGRDGAGRGGTGLYVVEGGSEERDGDWWEFLCTVNGHGGFSWAARAECVDCCRSVGRQPRRVVGVDDAGDDADWPEPSSPGSGLSAVADPSSDLGFAVGGVDLDALCTTRDHHGCGWRIRRECRDCAGVGAAR